jgi:hypothetical protein
MTVPNIHPIGMPFKLRARKGAQRHDFKTFGTGAFNRGYNQCFAHPLSFMPFKNLGVVNDDEGIPCPTVGHFAPHFAVGNNPVAGLLTCDVFNVHGNWIAFKDRNGPFGNSFAMETAPFTQKNEPFTPFFRVEMGLLMTFAPWMFPPQPSEFQLPMTLCAS